MCIGIPMQIVDYRDGMAVCRSEDELRPVDMMLLGKQPVGTWILVFLDCAREVLTEQRAGQIADALRAVVFSMSGAEVAYDDFFADLVNREPRLPDFLTGDAS